MTSLSEQEIQVPAAVPDPRMERAMLALRGLPPFSATLNRLIASLAGEDVSFIELGDLIEKDTVVSGNILGMVNSALYARRGTVTSVRHALSLLGTTKIRNVVLSLQVSGLWSKAKCPADLSIARFNQHSAAVGMLSDFLAQHSPVEYAEGAFVAGLLHDVGRLILALGLPVDFSAILANQRQCGAPLVECEAAYLSFNHAALSSQALQAWKLAEPIRRAVARHHETDFKKNEAGEIPLGQVLAAADRFANSVGLSTFDGAGEPEPDFTGIEGLGFSREKAEKLARDFQTEFEATANFYK